MEIVEEMKKLRELLDKKGIKWQDHSDDFGESEIKCNWICRTGLKLRAKEYHASMALELMADVTR